MVHIYLIWELSGSEREKILDAMRHWENKTCIRFYPGLNGPYGGILYFRGEWWVHSNNNYSVYRLVNVLELYTHIVTI